VKLSDVVASLEILKKYYVGMGGEFLEAQHDQIFVPRTDLPIDEADRKKLDDLGWFQDEVGEDEEGNRSYDPEAGWSAFT